VKTLVELALSLAIIATSANAAQPEQAFKEMFGDAYRSARGTPEVDDDRTIIRRIKNTASDLNSQSVRVHLLYKAVRLAVASDEVFEQGMAILDRLQNIAPDQHDRWQKIRLDAWNQRFRRARGADRRQVGRQMVDQATRIAEARADDGDLNAALTAYRRARIAATTLRLSSRQSINRAIDRINTRRIAQRRLDMFTRRYDQAPAPALADKIVEIFVVDLNQPARAMDYLDKTRRDDYKKHVPLAAQPTDQLSADQAADLGKWYMDLAQRARRELKPAMLRRARQGLAHAVNTGQSGSTDTAKVRIKLQDVKKQLASHGTSPTAAQDSAASSSAGSSSSSPFQTGHAYELLKYVDWSDRGGKNGDWVQSQTGLHANDIRSNSGFNIPVRIDGSYQLSVRLKVHPWTRDYLDYIPMDVRLYLPVGDNQRVFVRLPGGQQGPGLGVPDQPEFRSTAMQTNQYQQIHAQIKRDGEQVTIIVAISTRTLCRWRGPASQCHDNTRGPKNRIGMHVDEARASVTSVKLKLLDGTMEKVN